MECQRQKDNPQNPVSALERGTIAVRAVVSKIVRPTVRRWRPMAGIQKLQPRPCNSNKNFFAGFAV